MALLVLHPCTAARASTVPASALFTVRAVQERWPLDEENERFEAAEVQHRLRTDAYRAADRAAAADGSSRAKSAGTGSGAEGAG